MAPCCLQALGAAQGMAYLHEKEPPILHRDLKSDNLLVTGEWVCKVRSVSSKSGRQPQSAQQFVPMPAGMAQCLKGNMGRS